MSNLKFIVLLAAFVCLDEVWRLVCMVLVQLLQEALVSTLREEALLIQQGKDSHGLHWTKKIRYMLTQIQHIHTVARLISQMQSCVNIHVPSQ